MTTPQAPTIAQTLAELGPRTVEGDQGRYTAFSVDEAIKASQFETNKAAMKSKASIRYVLRTISGIRLLAHDGRGS